MMDWSCWNWGWGTMMFGGLGMLAVWGLVIGVIVWAIRGGLAPGGSSNSTPSARQGERVLSPLEILQARYARGEISRDEYETILRDLKSV